MAQPENIEVIEKRLWSATDTLRANSNHASNEYFLPVIGVIFLRHTCLGLARDRLLPRLMNGEVSV